MIKAYGHFREAVRLIERAAQCKTVPARNDTLTVALNQLADALAIYNNPELLIDVTAAGYLRRMECIWAIEQMIAVTYQLRGEPGVVCEQLSQLCQRIQRDCLTVIDQCKEAELDLLFPELLHLQQRDLPVLQTWQGQIEWCQTLSPREQKQLATLETQAEEAVAAESEQDELPEQTYYNSLKPTSHYLSLKDQLRFIVKPELRRNHENYIAERSQAAGYRALVPDSWHEISDLTVANLYWHLKQQTEPEAVMQAMGQAA